ncbi:hypothetical protein ACIOMM_19855 [Streptomyces sp. NPDC087908]|uniref:hypothetical protein n=1 Tax=Streptomyces sp. NPDC087908 TaxID=3365820 RepID=UPI00381F47B2
MKSVVRADVDTAAADAGVPANAPEYSKDSAANSPVSCGVYFKGFGEDKASVDIARFEQVVNELLERAWVQTQPRTERKGDGVIGVAEVWLSQRGWKMSVEYRIPPEEGVITVKAYDVACLKKHNVLK